MNVKSLQQRKCNVCGDNYLPLTFLSKHCKEKFCVEEFIKGGYMKNKRFVFGGRTDPRGHHYVAVDSEKNLAVSRSWSEVDIKILTGMHNSGEISTNYESRYVDQDVGI